MSLQNRPVLVVDDDPDMRQLIRKILETAGMKVFEAESVRQALEVADSSTPHLVILDLQMPGEAGFRFFERKLSHPALSNVPVMVVSAVNDRDSVYSAIASGACDYLIKPISTSLLLQKVRKALKDTEYKTVRFSKGQRPVARYSVPGEISKVGETSFLLETSVKLAPNGSIRIQSETLEQAGIDSCIYRTGSAVSMKSVTGQYATRVSVTGLSETLTKKLLKAKGPRS
jgi:DNA-binding response OmpR family regulator